MTQYMMMSEYISVPVCICKVIILIIIFVMFCDLIARIVTGYYNNLLIQLNSFTIHTRISLYK